MVKHSVIDGNLLVCFCQSMHFWIPTTHPHGVIFLNRCHTNAMVFNILNDAQYCHWMLPSVKLKWQWTCIVYIYMYHFEYKTCTFNTWYIHVHYIHTCFLITYDMRNPSTTLPRHPHNWSSRAIAVDPSTSSAGDPGFLLCWLSLSKRNGFCRLETNWFKE